MSFKDAIAWLNDTFHLGLDLERKIDPAEAKRAEIALQMRKEAREFEEWKDRMRFNMFAVWDEILKLLENRRDLYAPSSPGEEWNREFCQTVRLIPAVKRLVMKSYWEYMEGGK